MALIAGCCFSGGSCVNQGSTICRHIDVGERVALRIATALRACVGEVHIYPVAGAGIGHGVGVGATVDVVGACAAFDYVVACLAVQRVGTAAAVDGVVSGTAVDGAPTQLSMTYWSGAPPTNA